MNFERKGENRRTNGIFFNLNSFLGLSEFTIMHFGDRVLANALRFQCLEQHMSLVVHVKVVPSYRPVVVFVKNIKMLHSQVKVQIGLMSHPWRCSLVFCWIFLFGSVGRRLIQT